MNSHPSIYLFYAGQLVDQFHSAAIFNLHRSHIPYEILQGGYLYEPKDVCRRYWYRCDFTPVLDEDVPKQLKALSLLLF